MTLSPLPGVTILIDYSDPQLIMGAVYGIAAALLAGVVRAAWLLSRRG